MGLTGRERVTEARRTFAQARMMRRYIAWLNRNAQDKALRICEARHVA